MSLALRCLFFSASNETGATVRWRVLLALGGLGLAFYWLGLIRPYGLHALMVKPLLDIAQLTRDQPFAQAGFVATFAALSGLYYFGWRVCRGQRSRRMWIALLVAALAFNVSLMGLYPIGAADVFDNIMRGRITAQYGGNPFYETPNDYKRDPFRAYAAWRDATSAYGPVWEDLAAGASRVAGDDKLANVLVFKALGLVFYSGCIALIAAILRRQAPERAVQGVCLFAWNPLVIYETAGNGHNDIVMVFFVVLAMFAMSRRRFTSAALALAALLPEGAMARTVVLLSYAAVWKTIVFDFFLVPGRSWPPRLVRETLIGPATLGIVWLYAGYVLIARRLSRGVRYFRVQMTRP